MVQRSVNFSATLYKLASIFDALNFLCRRTHVHVMPACKVAMPEFACELRCSCSVGNDRYR